MLDPFKRPRNCSKLLKCRHLLIQYQRVMSGELSICNDPNSESHSRCYRFDKKVGDAVAVDEVVMEIETDKTTVGVPSPSHGIIEEIFVADGDTVKAGQQLFRLKITEGAPAPTPVAPKAEVSKPAETAPPPPVYEAPKSAVKSKLNLSKNRL